MEAKATPGGATKEGIAGMGEAARPRAAVEQTTLALGGDGEPTRVAVRHRRGSAGPSKHVIPRGLAPMGDGVAAAHVGHRGDAKGAGAVKEACSTGRCKEAFVASAGDEPRRGHLGPWVLLAPRRGRRGVRRRPCDAQSLGPPPSEAASGVPGGALRASGGSLGAFDGLSVGRGVVAVLLILAHSALAARRAKASLSSWRLMRSCRLHPNFSRPSACRSCSVRLSSTGPLIALSFNRSTTFPGRGVEDAHSATCSTDQSASFTGGVACSSSGSGAGPGPPPASGSSMVDPFLTLGLPPASSASSSRKLSGPDSLGRLPPAPPSGPRKSRAEAEDRRSAPWSGPSAFFGSSNSPTMLQSQP